LNKLFRTFEKNNSFLKKKTPIPDKLTLTMREGGEES